MESCVDHVASSADRLIRVGKSLVGSRPTIHHCRTSRPGRSSPSADPEQCRCFEHERRRVTVRPPLDPLANDLGSVAPGPPPFHQPGVEVDYPVLGHMALVELALGAAVVAEKSQAATPEDAARGPARKSSNHAAWAPTVAQDAPPSTISIVHRVDCQGARESRQALPNPCRGLG